MKEGTMSNNERKVVAVVGVFPDAQALSDAATEVHAKAKGHVEAYTPYPVHGLERKLGIKRSPLGYMVMLAGLSGAGLAILFQWWTSAVDYKIIIGGKPLFSWPAFVPITFELMVLFSAFMAVGGMIAVLNKLPFFDHYMLRSKSIAKVTADRFALAIEMGKTGFAAADMEELFRKVGTESTEIIYELEKPHKGIELLPLPIVIGIGIICLVVGIAFHELLKIYPELPLINYMHQQNKLNPQKGSEFFEDGIGMRQPVAGTVARGFVPYLITDETLASSKLFNPLPVTEATMANGKKKYDTFCGVCHGDLGNGEIKLSPAYKALPANLHSKSIRNYTDGQIFHVITNGKGAMKGYGSFTTVEERWEIIHYLRALQQSQNASDEELEAAMKYHETKKEAEPGHEETRDH
jgi:mono/diheme cytochrome c family protein